VYFTPCLLALLSSDLLALLSSDLLALLSSDLLALLSSDFRDSFWLSALSVHGERISHTLHKLNDQLGQWLMAVDSIASAKHLSTSTVLPFVATILVPNEFVVRHLSPSQKDLLSSSMGSPYI
jgi:hypothetical protein